MRKPVEAQFGFSDSELVRYAREKNKVKVVLKLWDERIIEISFNEVIGTKDMNCGNISEFCQETKQSRFFENALANEFVIIPESHDLLSFQFLNLDEEVSFEVIAKSYSIAEQKDPQIMN